eukprot:CAMPEP_0117011252 /NCGR_PEP_ID=MMETSP0472-20121206/9716_1 /TAXON_ID=693140 ORGANISM="Tiarina fusus, Strain LIS" /NCGR_SAMPLE_ID=MMETSP0472 /ASSEMBLY_ACC=CAM_ASM_000603 /LENGTH=217 /DNA_ID=CAMNT_0004714003 /DNA_START=28 /DNA_END=682 /DNA_ORIENTATION=+
MTMAIGFHHIQVTPNRPLDAPLAEMAKTPLHKEVSTVSFQEAHESRVIENATTLSKKEKLKRWVSADEFAQFKQDCIAILKDISQSGNADIYSYRGLEMVDPAATAKRQRHNTNSVACVLIEQREQRQKGKMKPKELRKAYKSTVMESMKEAIENAYLDSKAVEGYLANTIEEVRLEHSSSDRKEGASRVDQPLKVLESHNLKDATDRSREEACSGE